MTSRTSYSGSQSPNNYYYSSDKLTGQSHTASRVFWRMKVAILLLVLALFYSAGKFYTLYTCSSLYCTIDSACTYKSVRLYNGTAASNSSGMLQMCRSNAWTAVCDYRWKQSLSVKVCKALGYTNPSMHMYM